jgi:hypothetical protein
MKTKCLFRRRRRRTTTTTMMSTTTRMKKVVLLVSLPWRSSRRVIRISPSYRSLLLRVVVEVDAAAAEELRVGDPLRHKQLAALLEALLE